MFLKIKRHNSLNVDKTIKKYDSVCYNNTKVGPDTLPYLSYSWDTSN